MEYVLQQLMDGLTREMAIMGGYKVVGTPQQENMKSPKDLKLISERIKALTRMIRYLYHI